MGRAQVGATANKPQVSGMGATASNASQVTAGVDAVTPTRILFICHGNICRSTMAQFVMQDLVEKAGRAADFVIDSAATSTEEIGNPPHHGTVAKLREVGVPVLSHRARQIRRADYDQWDHIIYMDAENARGLRRILGDDPQGKVSRLLDWTSRPADVADPWYTGNFDATYRDVLAGCQALLASL